MKLFIVGFLVILVQVTNQLPVKEASTEKDPNAHKEGSDSAQQNLENVIGKHLILSLVITSV